MKLSIAYKITFAIIIAVVFTPALTIAEPAQPGDGQDPFATPVNGYIAVVTFIAFIYGVYRIYKQSLHNRLDS